VLNPSSNDWIGIYHPGDANEADLDYVWTGSCSKATTTNALASGSCSITMPTAPGTYEVRLLHLGPNFSVTRLAGPVGPITVK
jgi:hypothetical protein